MLSTATLALVISGLGGLLWAFIGLVLVFAVVFFIMRQAGAPPIAYTILYVVLGIIALVAIIDIFFGGDIGGGSVIVH